jgi:hypothetical protein
MAKEVISIHTGKTKPSLPSTPSTNKTEPSKENKLKNKVNQWKSEQRQNNVSLVVKKG